MIIIDQNGETKLAETLERAREQVASGRCIHLSFKDTPAPELQNDIIDMARGYLTATDAQLYICRDGDIFILARNLPKKISAQLVEDIANYSGHPISEDWVGFYEFPLHTSQLLGLVSLKLDILRQKKAAQRKEADEKLIALKRQQILNGGRDSQLGDIKSRRRNRNHPELMIIEDDAFSRKLVENVLKQKFMLTGLGKADTALDTYTRIAPDLVFLDINLPDVTGHELLEKIVTLDPEAYVIMLSGNCDKDNINQAMSKGAKGFVAKPFTTDKLYQYISRCPTIKKEVLSN